MTRFHRYTFLLIAVGMLGGTATLEARWPRCICNYFARRACHRGSVRDLDRWAFRGAYLYHVDRHGRTLLHEVAIGEGTTDVARWLLGRGVDQYARDRSGNTALELAEARNNYFLINVLETGSVISSHDLGVSDISAPDMTHAFDRRFSGGGLPESPIDYEVAEHTRRWVEEVREVVERRDELRYVAEGIFVEDVLTDPGVAGCDEEE